MSAQAKPSTTPAQGKATDGSAQKDSPGHSLVLSEKRLPEGKLASVEPVASSDATAANDATSEAGATNLIKRTVDEIYGLLAETHEMREELLARGIQFHMMNALIELGVQAKTEEQEKLIETALEASRKAHGSQAIDRQALERHLAEIVTLEKDLRHVRHVASQQGVHMQAVNHLTQLMRLNPGDRGVHAVNTFVAYADAAGIPLDRVEQIREQVSDGPTSVLPDIPLELEVTRKEKLVQLACNLIVGVVLTAGVMWMVL